MATTHRAAVIELAENLIALATDLSEAVMFIAERGVHHPYDEAELIRILAVAAKLKQLAESVKP